MKTKITSLLLLFAIAGVFGCSEEEETAWALPEALNGKWFLTSSGEAMAAAELSADEEVIKLFGYYPFEEPEYNAGQFTASYDLRNDGINKYGRMYGTMHDRNTISISITTWVADKHTSVSYTGKRAK